MQNARWATDGKTGERAGARLESRRRGVGVAVPLRWETPNPSCHDCDAAASACRAIAGWEIGRDVACGFTVDDPAREIVKLFAVVGHERLPLEIPTFPDAQDQPPDFRIADGKEFTVFQEGTKRVPLTLGKGNGDGQANPGEKLAILLPDGNAWRAAELFTNDACVDLRERVSDVWSDYDHVGASAKYSLPVIQPGCPAGHVVRMLARVQCPHAPDHRVEYFKIEFPVRSSGSATTK